RHDRISAKGDVEGCAAPDRWIAVRSSHSSRARSSAPGSARATGAQLSCAQEPASGNSSSDKIFLGGQDTVGGLRSEPSVKFVFFQAGLLAQRRSNAQTLRDSSRQNNSPQRAA